MVALCGLGFRAERVLFFYNIAPFFGAWVPWRCCCVCGRGLAGTRLTLITVLLGGSKGTHADRIVLIRWCCHDR